MAIDAYLDIINDQDEVIGKALRSEIHSKGLLHREVRVYFITPEKKVIFQKRSLTKKINPGLLSAAAGGHVELGQSYIEAALMEIREETGLVLAEDDLHLLVTHRDDYIDKEKDIADCAIMNVYGHVLTKPIESLEIEVGQIEGFVAINWTDIINPPESLLTQSETYMFAKEIPLIREKLEKLVP